VLSIFFGWLRTRTGAIWAGSVAHATNNIGEDSWWRLAFTGRTGGVPSMSAVAPLLLAETTILTGIVAGNWLFNHRRSLRVGAVPGIAMAQRQGQL
jgi:membrane protease YdiL (CAAX protease family)